MTNHAKPRATHKQYSLGMGWGNFKLNSYREGMPIVGDFFEEATSKLFNKEAKRLEVTNECEICPDLQEATRGEFFIECKASKDSYYKNDKPRGYFKMLKERVTSYKNFLGVYFPVSKVEDPDFEPVLIYAFWVYDIGKIKVGDFKSVDELFDGLAKAKISLCLIDASTIHQYFENKHLSAPPSYGPMYVFRHNELNPIRTGDYKSFLDKCKLPNNHLYCSFIKKNLKVYDRKVKKFPVYMLLDKTAYEKPNIKKFIKENVK